MPDLGPWLIWAGMVLVVLVGLTLLVYLVELAADALHAHRNGMPDGSSTLDVQNHLGDPNDPTSGVPS